MLAAAALLAGCAMPPGTAGTTDAQLAEMAAPAPPSTAAGALLSFVASAAPGTRTTISDPATGAPMFSALVQEEYFSASGYECKRLILQPAAGAIGGGGPSPVERAACRDKRGWHLARPLRRDGLNL